MDVQKKIKQSIKDISDLIRENGQSQDGYTDDDFTNASLIFFTVFHSKMSDAYLQEMGDDKFEEFSSTVGRDIGKLIMLCTNFKYDKKLLINKK